MHFSSCSIVQRTTPIARIPMRIPMQKNRYQVQSGESVAWLSCGVEYFSLIQESFRPIFNNLSTCFGNQILKVLDYGQITQRLYIIAFFCGSSENSSDLEMQSLHVSNRGSSRPYNVVQTATKEIQRSKRNKLYMILVNFSLKLKNVVGRKRK